MGESIRVGPDLRVGLRMQTASLPHSRGIPAPCLSFPVAALLADADMVPKGTSGAPRDWHCPLPIPHPQCSSGLASPRLPWAPGSARIKGACAGWRALARRALPCPVLPGPPTGSPERPWLRAGQWGRAGTLPQPWAGARQVGTLPCASHMWGWVWWGSPSFVPVPVGWLGDSHLCPGGIERSEEMLSCTKPGSVRHKASSGGAGDTSRGCSQPGERLVGSSGRKNEKTER